MERSVADRHEAGRGGCPVCEHLAYDEILHKELIAMLQERVASLEEDVDWAVDAWKVAVETVRALTAECDRKSRHLAALRERVRAVPGGDPQPPRGGGMTPRGLTAAASGHA